LATAVAVDVVDYGWEWKGKDWAKGLGWEERELLNFLNLALMPSETEGILRSLWVIWLETYQGALRRVRRTLDWKLWMLWMLAGHSSTP
jgi:hypothetical protein